VLMSSTRTLMFAGRFANSSLTWWRGTRRRSSIPLLYNLPTLMSLNGASCSETARLQPRGASESPRSGRRLSTKTKAMRFNDLWDCARRLSRQDRPSESLSESGLRLSAGKTFPAAPFRENAIYTWGQSVARASAGGTERNSTPTRYRIGSSGPDTRRM